jgi:hypothetical protein
MNHLSVPTQMVRFNPQADESELNSLALLDDDTAEESDGYPAVEIIKWVLGVSSLCLTSMHLNAKKTLSVHWSLLFKSRFWWVLCFHRWGYFSVCLLCLRFVGISKHVKRPTQRKLDK